MSKQTLSMILTVALAVFFCFGVSHAKVELSVSDPETALAASLAPNLPQRCQLDLLYGQGKLKGKGGEAQGFSQECKEEITRKKAKEDASSCVSATTAFASSQRELNTACGNAPALNSIIKAMGVAPEDSKYKNSACVNNILLCNQCASDGKASHGDTILECGNWSDLDSEDEDEDEPKKSASSVISTTLSLFSGNIASAGATSKKTKKELMQELGTCLPKSVDQLDTLKEAVKDSRKKKSELEKEHLENQDLLGELKQKFTDVNNRAQTRAETLKEQAQTEMTELKRKLDEATEKASADFAQKQMEAESQISRLEMERIKAENVRIETIAELERGCHATALKVAADARALAMEKIKNSVYTAGNFNDLMGTIGKSERQRYQKIAENAYRDCRNDGAFKSVTATAERAKTSTTKMIDSEIQQRRKAISAGRLELMKYKTTQNQAVLQEMERISKKLEIELNKVSKENASSASDVQRKFFTQTQKANLLEQNLGLTTQEHEEQNEKMRLLRKYTGDAKGTQPGTVDKAISAFEHAVKLAEEAKTACCTEDLQGSIDARNNCANVSSFLNEKVPDFMEIPKSDQKLQPATGGEGTR